MKKTRFYWCFGDSAVVVSCFLSCCRYHLHLTAFAVVCSSCCLATDISHFSDKRLPAPSHQRVLFAACFSVFFYLRSSHVQHVSQEKRRVSFFSRSLRFLVNIALLFQRRFKLPKTNRLVGRFLKWKSHVIRSLT